MGRVEIASKTFGFGSTVGYFSRTMLEMRQRATTATIFATSRSLVVGGTRFANVCSDRFPFDIFSNPVLKSFSSACEKMSDISTESDNISRLEA